MAIPLVGRDAALAAIDSALGELGRRQVGVLRVTGEPGIGKTRLLTGLAARAAERGFLVLEGRAAEFENDLPFGVFVDALDDYLVALGPRAHEQLDPASVSHLAAVFPAFASVASEPVTLLDERYRAHRGVRSLLDRLARPKPLVLVLDDLHWIDGASGELLRHLIAHPPSRRVVIAVAYRPAHLDDRMRTALDRGEVEGRVQPLDLGPLSRADSRLLIGDQVANDLFDAIYSESGGNPFYLLELARAASRGRMGGRVEAASEVPHAVSAAIEHEIATLAEDARALLQGAAVAGEPFPADLAAVAAGMSETGALSALDDIVEAELIRPTDVPLWFEFRHPLVRRAVYESARPGWRIGAHRRLADALRKRGAPTTLLAHHIEVAARPGDEQAIKVLTDAGRSLAYSAPGIAARRFEAALRLLPDAERAAESRLQLLVPLATSLGAAGRLRESRRTLDEALSLLPPDAGAPRAQLEAFCAAVEHLLGLHAEAHRRLSVALEALPDGHSAEAAGLMVELAAHALWVMDWDAMRAWAAKAREVAHDAAQRPLEATALTLLALGEYSVGQPGRGVEPLELAAGLVDAMSDAELEAHLEGPYYLVWAAFWLERYEQVVHYADRGLALARATGHGQFFAPTLAAKACGLRRLGHLREAAQAAQEAVESARLAGHDQIIAFVLGVRAWVASAESELDIALSASEEALQVLTRLGPSMIRAAAGWWCGEPLLEAGEPVRCAALVLDAVGGPEAGLPSPVERCYSWHLLARADAQLGRLRAAQEWIERLDAETLRLSPSGLPRYLTESARAHVLLASGEAAAAAQAALAAADAAESVHARPDASRARLLAGRALGAAGERQPSIALLERARCEFELYGAARWRDESIRELRRLGRRVGRGGRRASAQQGVQALSDRELAIAELVAAGRTNKEIGAELLISAKTVERHLSHVFRKLDVSSRAQVAVHLALHGRR